MVSGRILDEGPRTNRGARLDANNVASWRKELNIIWTVGLFVQGPHLVNSEIDVINEILGDRLYGFMLFFSVNQD